MMDYSDRHFRWVMRRITRRTLLYTEMITTGAILHGNREAILDFDPAERPVAIQLGGDDPVELAESARIAAERGYDEINLNVGCPSDRVREGHFGACLMARPEVVAAGVTAMRDAVGIPVTVKHRIGINGMESYDDMARFVATVARTGCDRFTVHARIAVLGGLNPKQNRSVPPLRYDDVYRLKHEFPELTIEINGGIRAMADVHLHLEHVDGVMIGRAACDDPYLFATADAELFDDSDPIPTRREIIAAVAPYMDRWVAAGTSPLHIARHLLGLFAHQPGARAWRRSLSEQCQRGEGGGEILWRAATAIPDAVLDARPE